MQRCETVETHHIKHTAIARAQKLPSCTCGAPLSQAVPSGMKRPLVVLSCGQCERGLPEPGGIKEDWEIEKVTFFRNLDGAFKKL